MVQAAQQVSRNKVIPFSSTANPLLDFGQFHNYFDPGLNAGLHPPPSPSKPALECGMEREVGFYGYV